jgi:hypothetical protein
MFDDSLDDLYERAMHSREPNCWPNSYRNAPYPCSKFATTKVGRSAFIDVEHIEDAEEILKKVKQFHRWWRKTIKIEFLISGHEEGYGVRKGAGVDYVIRIERVK